KNSVYLLPATAEHAERVQWLTQDVQRDGGEATLLRVERIENMADAEVIRLFRDARDRDYADLAARYRVLLGQVERRPGRLRAAQAARREDEARRLGKELGRVKEIDFFDAPGFPEVERLREALDRRLRPGDAGPAAAIGEETALGGLRGRRWVTRPRPHVDRIASAWLIRRFMDPEAEFVFAPPEARPPDAIPFDMVGVELGHRGDDCTFETLVKRAGLRDPALAALAEIVHEADLRDEKFDRLEGRGLDLVLRGLLAAVKDDHEALAHGMTLFDGLYAVVGQGRAQ
ncbi:MAG TPA: chromate resistance protein ChrB domain-containing protein, partial [Candidatus Binatia bacterium]|nr:chromate resistance protein ChrB domain-containing protein [Candidatus Binatia bacterium]